MKKNKFIPYQKCPVCEGRKETWVNQYDPVSTAINIGWRPCGVCLGTGIILMHKILKEKK